MPASGPNGAITPPSGSVGLGVFISHLGDCRVARTQCHEMSYADELRDDPASTAAVSATGNVAQSGSGSSRSTPIWAIETWSPVKLMPLTSATTVSDIGVTPGGSSANSGKFT